MNGEEKIMIIHVEVIGNNSQFIILKFWQSCDKKKKKVVVLELLNKQRQN